MRRTALALIGALPFFLSACRPRPDLRHLEISVRPASPADLPPGTIVEIVAMPVPAGQMAWVSGTVKIFRAPVLAFKKSAVDGSFMFRTMVPPMATVPAGSYEVRAWGRTVAGEDVEGRLDYKVR